MNKDIFRKWKWRILLALILALVAKLLLVTTTLGQDVPVDVSPGWLGIINKRRMR